MTHMTRHLGQVELQVSQSGACDFHGFGGLLQQVELEKLPDVALEAKEERSGPRCHMLYALAYSMPYSPFKPSFKYY